METAVLVVAGWTSGINAYLTVVLLGLAGRLGWVDVPESLTRPWVLAVCGVLFALEFVADKLPVFDSVWDVAHGLVRPAVGTAIGVATAAAPGADIDLPVAVAIGGGLALVAHLSKATTRLALNVSPEPASNVAASLTEDATVTGLVALAVAYPVIAAVATLTAMVVFAVAALTLVTLAGRGLRLLRQQVKGARVERPG